MAAKRDYYTVLGLGREASGDQIKKAYRKVALKYHPDRNPGDKDAEERFKEVSEAHAVLSDAEKRKQYDRMRRLGAFDGARAGTRPGGAGAPGTADAEGFDFGGLGGLGDIFSSIFGRARLSAAMREPSTTPSSRVRV